MSGTTPWQEKNAYRGKSIEPCGSKKVKVIPYDVNSTFFSLIPKVVGTKSFIDLCPIRLYNTLYKIMAKGLATRLKFFLSSLITIKEHLFKGAK